MIPNPKDPTTWPAPNTISGPDAAFQARWNAHAPTLGQKLIEALALIHGEITKIDPTASTEYFQIRTPQGEFTLQSHYIADHEAIAKLAEKDRLNQITQIIEEFESGHPEKDRRDIFYDWVSRSISDRKNFSPKNNPTLDGLIYHITVAFLRKAGFRLHS